MLDILSFINDYAVSYLIVAGFSLLLTSFIRGLLSQPGFSKNDFFDAALWPLAICNMLGNVTKLVFLLFRKTDK